MLPFFSTPLLGLALIVLALWVALPSQVIQYPIKVAKPGGVNFVKRWNFMFARFSPTAYYFAFVLNMRNLLIGLIPVPWSHRATCALDEDRSCGCADSGALSGVCGAAVHFSYDHCGCVHSFTGRAVKRQTCPALRDRPGMRPASGHGARRCRITWTHAAWCALEGSVHAYPDELARISLYMCVHIERYRRIWMQSEEAHICFISVSEAWHFS